MAVSRSRTSRNPDNVFDLTIIRPNDFNGSDEIRCKPGKKVVLDSCHELRRLKLHPSKPTGTVQILGPFPENLWIEGRFNDLRMGGSMQLVDWGGFPGEWSTGSICNRLWNMPDTPDILVMIFPQSSGGTLHLKPQHCGNTIAIRGPSTAKRLIIEPETEMDRILILNMPWLEEIELRGRVKSMEVSNTPRLQSLSGHGRHLRCYTNSHRRNGLSLRGFWLNLDIGSSECNLSSFILPEGDVKNGDDLKGRIMHTDEYETACIWADAFKVDIQEALKGLRLEDLITLWRRDEVKARRVFTAWFNDERFIVDRRYYGMRIALRQLHDGDSGMAVRTRNFVLGAKADLYPVIVKHRTSFPRYRNPLETFAPSDLLDLEFIANVLKGLDDFDCSSSLRKAFKNHDQLIDSLRALQQKRDADYSSLILDVCKARTEDIDSGGPRGFPPYHQFDILSGLIRTLEEIKEKQDVSPLVQTIGNHASRSTNDARTKAMMIIALMQVDDQPGLRKILGSLSSELSLRATKLVNTFRMCGVSAFERLGLEPLKYPYHIQWRRYLNE